MTRFSETRCGEWHPFRAFLGAPSRGAPTSKRSRARSSISSWPGAPPRRSSSGSVRSPPVPPSPERRSAWRCPRSVFAAPGCRPPRLGASGSWRRRATRDRCSSAPSLAARTRKSCRCSPPCGGSASGRHRCSSSSASAGSTSCRRADLGIREGVRRLDGLEERPSAKEVRTKGRALAAAPLGGGVDPLPAV